jgi:hypothetical protein
MVFSVWLDWRNNVVRAAFIPMNIQRAKALLQEERPSVMKRALPDINSYCPVGVDCWYALCPRNNIVPIIMEGYLNNDYIKHLS